MVAWMESVNMRNEVDDIIQKAKKKGGPDWKRMAGLIDWVGEKGFNECVSKVSRNQSTERAKKICGAMKREARSRGTLSSKHMGSEERKKYLKRKREK